MANLTRTFIKGRMNKEVTERLVPKGEYIDALNVRLNSTEQGDVGAIENSKGNELVVALTYLGQPLSNDTRCIGAYKDGSRETLYWFVHDGSNPNSATGVVDMLVSYNISTQTLRYHLVSVELLSFSEQYLITGVSMVEDLLFWTDNLNPPRKINIRRTYGNPIGANDGFEEEDISVIVSPPASAPGIELTNVPGDENFLSDRFISFSYRYKYRDGEYSALSQFSEVAFQPSPFEISEEEVLNVGMENFYNSCIVEFNTGPSRVIGIDLVFKLSDDSTIRIIDKYVKSEENWGDNQIETLQFTNKQIYTILPESEVLRLYDNVPLLAQAQTLMGNRLMYGNYVEGYDIEDANGVPIEMDFSAQLLSQNIGFEERVGDISTGDSYIIDPLSSAVTVPASKADLSLEGLSLTAGAAFSFSIVLAHDSFGGQSGSLTPNDFQDPFTVSFVFILDQDYSNANDAVSSIAFQQQIGTNSAANFQPIANCNDGTTLTDLFNCQVVAPNGWSKTGSGIANLASGINIYTSTTNPNYFGVQFPAFQYTNGTSSDVAYEYLKVTNVELTYLESANGRSLHSNRDYELGIIYMDNYGRSSTALVSNNNTVFVPVSNSDKRNYIRATIPFYMAAPYWATRYKFALKPTKTDYQTVYSVQYYYDPDGDGVWFRLDGENQAKVEAGDTFIVKSDSAGPLDTLVEATVLDKRTFQRDDLSEGSLPGVYARIIAENFLVSQDAGAINGCVELEDDTAGNNPDGPYIEYLVSSAGTPWNIPVGSEVQVRIRTGRTGVSNNCGCMTWQWSYTAIANANYNNLKELWDGEALYGSFDSAVDECPSQPDDFGPTTATYYSNLPDRDAGDYEATSETQFGNTKVQFVEDSATGNLWLTVRSGITPCSGLFGGEPAWLKVEVCVNKTSRPIIFETKPSDALPDIFYEGSQTFLISNGLHQGNVQNQSATDNCISDLSFFDCFSFGNGVESYRAKDSILGKYFGLGQRVTTTSAQDYKRAHRFADITYSGIYSDESNVNKLNEFNAGLLNFKELEEVYGPIQRMEGRQTDVLALQEDKISYVLTGKNLLSDAGGGGALTSVPEVLGQQVARAEEYGISSNPESYAQFGYDKYFTDVKRGAVILLRGDSYSNEQLEVVSKMGMRSYFRNLFIQSMSKQKLGGYDPYTDEYVLHSNDIDLPVEGQCLDCDIIQDVYILPNQTIELCFNSGGLLGSVDAVVSVGTRIAGSSVSAYLAYDIDVDTQSISAGSEETLTVDANDATLFTYTLTITDTSGLGAYVSYNVSCPEVVPLTIKVVSINANSQVNESVHHNMRWTSGTYNSPYFTEQVTFGTSTDQFAISQCTSLVGTKGTGYYAPSNGADIELVSYVQPTDNYDVDANHYRVYFGSSGADIDVCDFATLDAEIDSGATLNWAPPESSSAGFNDSLKHVFSYNGTDDYIFIVFDYRKSADVELCNVDTETPTSSDIQDACCDCETCYECTSFTSTVVVSLSSNPCSLLKDQTYYHDGESALPAVGDRIYTDAGCTTPANYGFLAYERTSKVDIKLQIGTNGLVLAESLCDTTANFTITCTYGASSEAGACAQSALIRTVYTFYAINLLGVGDAIVLSDQDLDTNPQYLYPGFYKLSDGYVVQIGTNGIITYKSATTC